MLKAQDLLNKCQLAIELKVLLTFVTAIAFLSQYFFFSYLSLMKNSTALKTGNLRKSKSSVTSILPFIHSSPQSLDSKFDFPTPSSMLSSPTISATYISFCQSLSQEISPIQQNRSTKFQKENHISQFYYTLQLSVPPKLYIQLRFIFNFQYRKLIPIQYPEYTRHCVCIVHSLFPLIHNPMMCILLFPHHR